MSRLRILACCIAGTLCAASTDAWAYCRATTCDRAKVACGEDMHGCLVEGVPVRWEKDVVSLGVASGSLLRDISPDAAATALADALSTWASVRCPGGDAPSLSFESLGVLEGATVGFTPNQPNQGVTAFFDEGFPGGAGAVARTLLGLNLRTGEILDADLILNSEHFPLAESESSEGDIDVVAVLTHEVGHVLGLDHSDVAGATMQAETDGFGTEELRTLEPDDIAGLCALYPPGGSPEDTPPPQNPGSTADRSGCSIGRVGSPSLGGQPLGAVFSLGALIAVTVRHRRRGRTTLSSG